MVYLDNITDTQRVWFPVAPARLEGAALTLVFRNTTDQRSFTLAGELCGDFSDDFSGDFDRPARGSSRIAFALPADLPVGEYEYALLAGWQTQSVGLAWIGQLGTAEETDHHAIFDQYEADND